MRRAIMNKSEAAESLKVFEELIPAYIACMDDLSTAGNEKNTAIAERAEKVIQAFDHAILEEAISQLPYYVVRERVKPINVDIILDMCDILKGRGMGEKIEVK